VIRAFLIRLLGRSFTFPLPHSSLHCPTHTHAHTNNKLHKTTSESPVVIDFEWKTQYHSRTTTIQKQLQQQHQTLPRQP
jgi:hypothetical protein